MGGIANPDDMVMICPTILFHVRGRILATKLSPWPASRVEQFASNSSSFGQFAFFQIDIFVSLCFSDWRIKMFITPFRAGFAHEGH